MNILIINPPNKPATNPSILAEPIDCLQLATLIKQHHPQVQVLDMDTTAPDHDINAYLDKKNVVIFVYDYQLPLHTTAAKENIFSIIKKCHKETKFIIVGKTSTYWYEEFLSHGIDIVMKGLVEAEINQVIEYCYNLEKLQNIPNLVIKNHNEIIMTETKVVKSNFSKLPIPDRSLVNINNYMDTRTMVTSRGCIGTCNFCTTPSFFGRWDFKSADQVVEEIELLVTKYHASKIMFLDDNATVNKNRMLQICKQLKQKKFKCLFGALCSIKCYDKELLEEMYQAGFRFIHFGLESGSERILRKMNKFLDIDITKEIITEVKTMGYRVRTSFILDYPKTTVEDIKKTKDLILELEPHEIRLHYLAYRVGTPIFKSRPHNATSQYIHSPKPLIERKNIMTEIDKLLEALQDQGYNIISENIDWNQYNNKDKNTKIAAFTPIKYGMCWYE